MTDREFWIQVMMRYVERGWDVKDAATYTDFALEELKKRKFEDDSLLQRRLRFEQQLREMDALSPPVYKSSQSPLKRSAAEARQEPAGEKLDMTKRRVFMHGWHDGTFKGENGLDAAYKKTYVKKRSDTINDDYLAPRENIYIHLSPKDWQMFKDMLGRERLFYSATAPKENYLLYGCPALADEFIPDGTVMFSEPAGEK